MLKLYFLLFIEFSKIGFFAIGGGYASIPFLFYLQSQYNWFSIEELTNMIAIANITPGPIGINMATYTGFKTAGMLGAVISTISIVLLPFVLTLIITKLFTKFQHNQYVNYVFVGLRSAACALLSYISIKLLVQTLSLKNWNDFDFSSLILFIVLIIPFSFVKKNPILTIIAGGLGGILIDYCFQAEPI